MSNTKPEATLSKISKIVLDPEFAVEVRLPALVQLYNSLPESEKAKVDLIASGLQQRNLVLNEGAELRGIMAILLDRKLVGEDRGPALELLARYLGRDGAPLNPVVVERAARQLLYPSAIPPELSRDDLVEKRARQIVGVLRDATCLREAFAIAARTSPQLRAILTRRKDFYLDANGQPRSGEIGLSASGKFKAMFAGICGTSEGRGLLRIAIDAGNRETRDRFWKSASSKRPLFEPCVVVGAGPSSVVYRSAVATLCPGQAPVVIDRRGHSGGQFAEVLNPVFGLNSRARPMRGDDPRGNLPGVDGELNSLGPYAVVQQSDLTGSAFGDQSSIGLAVEINHTLAGGVVTHTMLNRWAAVTTEAGEQHIILELQRSDTGDKAIVQTGRLVSARGFQRPRCAFEARPGEDAPAIGAAVATRTQEILAQERDKANSGERSQYRLFPRFMADMGDRSDPFPLQGINTVAVLGAGDSGCVTVQALLGYGPSTTRAPLTLDRVLRVDWYGQESLTKEEYARDKSVPYQLLAGEFPRKSEPTRPFRVQPFKDKAVGLDRDEQGRLYVVDPAGKRGPYDLVVDCSGFVQTPLEQLYDPALESLVKGATEAQLPPSGGTQSEIVGAMGSLTSTVQDSSSNPNGRATSALSEAQISAATDATIRAIKLAKRRARYAAPLADVTLREKPQVQLVSRSQLADIPADSKAVFHLALKTKGGIVSIGLSNGVKSVSVFRQARTRTSIRGVKVANQPSNLGQLFESCFEKTSPKTKVLLRRVDARAKRFYLVSIGASSDTEIGAVSDAERGAVVLVASNIVGVRGSAGPAKSLQDQDPQLQKADVRRVSLADLRSVRPDANSVLYVARRPGALSDGSPRCVPVLFINGLDSISFFSGSYIPSFVSPFANNKDLNALLMQYARESVSTIVDDEARDLILLRAVPGDNTVTATPQAQASSNKAEKEEGRVPPSETVAAAENPASMVSGSNSRNRGEATAEISSSLVTAARVAATDTTSLICRSSGGGYTSTLTNFYNAVANPGRDDFLVQLASYNQLAEIPSDKSTVYFIALMASADSILPIAMVDGDSSIWVGARGGKYEVLSVRGKPSNLRAVLESSVPNLQTFLRGQDRDTKELVLVSTGALSDAERSAVVQLASKTVGVEGYPGPAKSLREQDPQLKSADVRRVSLEDLRSIQSDDISVLYVARFSGSRRDGSQKCVPLLFKNGEVVYSIGEENAPLFETWSVKISVGDLLMRFARESISTISDDQAPELVLLRAVPQDATTTALAQPERSSNNGGRELKLDQVMDIVGGDLVPLAQQVSGLEVYMIGPEARLRLTPEQLERRKATKTPQNLAALFFHSSPITALAENHAANPIETPKSQLAGSRRGQPSELQRVKRASGGSLYSIDEASFAMPSADVSRLLGDTTDPKLVVQMFVQSAFRDCIADRGETRPYALVLSLGKSGGSKPKRVIRVDSTHAFPSPIQNDPMFGAATMLLLSRLPGGERETKIRLVVPLKSRDGALPEFQWHRAAWSSVEGEKFYRVKKDSSVLGQIRAREAAKNQAGGQESE